MHMHMHTNTHTLIRTGECLSASSATLAVSGNQGNSCSALRSDYQNTSHHAVKIEKGGSSVDFSLLLHRTLLSPQSLLPHFVLWFINTFVNRNELIKELNVCIGAYVCVRCASDGKDLFIGKAVQKAYLEVTEEGAEGAAGSGDVTVTS